MSNYKQLLESMLSENSEQFYVIDSDEYLNEDILEEGVFSGLSSKVASLMTKGYKGSLVTAGQNSPVEEHAVNTKAELNKHLSKMTNNHAIIKHNGKVIASVHPKYETNGSFSSVEPNKQKYETDASAGNTEAKFSKKSAVSHIHSAIEKAGGFKGHKVEIKLIGADDKRDEISNNRKIARMQPNLKNSKSMTQINKRAVGKLGGNSAAENAAMRQGRAVDEKTMKNKFSAFSDTERKSSLADAAANLRKK